ncbi:hypothetical protein EUX98_g5883 [Antrodiella citrinella]|uniref:Uncharacterized protein n=1 Tax=Antrodiella citrinella TaxID=2447956 RepID=A0A4S4MQD6_9APHY|nr:hypothetical protein EUX98_g5883 [Antrodiella citrinella]
MLRLFSSIDSFDCIRRGYKCRRTDSDLDTNGGNHADPQAQGKRGVVSLILILTACNLAAIKTSPTATQDPNTRQSFVSSNLGTVPQIFNDITYMLLSRFLLNLRSIHYPPTEIPGDTSKQVSEVRFAHTLTANIGAPLETSCSNIEDDNEQVFSSDPITFGISDEERRPVARTSRFTGDTESAYSIPMRVKF